MARLSRLVIRAAVLAAVALISPRLAVAQPSRTGYPVTARVTSQSGAAIAGAEVVLRSEAMALEARTDGHGIASFAFVPGGLYTVGARAKNFAPASGTVTVLADRPTTIAIVLSRAGGSSLLTIAQVRANGTPALSTAPAPSVNINALVYASQGVTRTSDILEDELSTTVVPVIGGGLNAPAVVALRGPDPSETLVSVDGHQVNNGNTGDYDLSLLDPADLENVQIIYGIAPSALYGPNTLGGALNVVTLEPTLTPESLERLSYGSFGTFTGTLQATGTDDRFGYAFSIHRMTSAGELNDVPFPNTTDPNNGSSAGTSPIGNDMAALSDIAKIQYAFAGGGFIDLTFHNQAVYRDLSATLSSIGPPAVTGVDRPTYSNFSGSSLASNDDAYGVDLDLPLATSNGAATSTLLFRHETSLVSQVVNGAAAGSSPYLYNDRDLIADDTLEFDRELPHAELSFKTASTEEALVTDNILGVIYADEYRIQPEWVAPWDSVTNGDALATVQHLSQRQRWVAARYTDDPTPKLHYSFATYYSAYSSFGHSVDPRFGFVWTPASDSAVRLSIGSTFQSPQLPTFIVPGPNQPVPVVGGYASIGNKNATAERSTEYDLGYEHLFHLGERQVHLGIDVYRTDLHNGVATYYGPSQCTTATVELDDDPPCLSYPVNVTREVYQGIELRGDAQLTPALTLHAAWDVDSAYIQSFPPSAADGVLPYEQDLGLPLHKLSVDFQEHPSPQFSYYAGVLYEGQYNELDLPPFATLRAGMSWQFRDVNVTLAGENLTNAYDFLYTRAGGGIAYGAVPSPISTDAYPLPGRRITLVLTRKT